MTDQTCSSYVADSVKERGSAATKRTTERPAFDTASYTLRLGVLESSGSSSKHLQMYISMLAKSESAKGEDVYSASACVRNVEQGNLLH